MPRIHLKRSALLLTARILPKFWASHLHNPVFIIGCARSGTTILTELLSFHRDIADLSEANDIWDPTGYPWSESPRETPPIWIDPIAHAQRWWRDVEPRQQEVQSIFGAYQVLMGKNVFVNKTPLNTFRIPYLLRMFPDAKFLHIYRDGRATVHSYTVKQFKDIHSHIEAYRTIEAAQSECKFAGQIAWFWAENIREIHRQDASLKLTKHGKLLEVSYEQLCANVPQVLGDICNFIGIDNTRFLPQVWQQEVKSSNYKWEAAFGPELVKDLEAKMQSEMRQLGYLT